MKLVSALHDGGEVVGVVDGDTVRLLDGVREVGPDTPTDVLRTARVRAEVPWSEITLRAVVPSPRRILCVGLNYRSHIEETRRADQEYPVLFPKFASSLLADGEDIVLPPESSQVDYEGELAVVIGTTVRRASTAEAWNAVLGYTVANDVTMRDFQYRSHQWLQGKAWDRTTPLGPVLVTPDELGPLDDLAIITEVDDVEVQSSVLGNMIFSVDELISTISTFTTLEPGDVILTGTPGGVGFRREPPLFLQPGSRVRVHIDGIGDLVNVARAE